MGAYVLQKCSNHSYEGERVQWDLAEFANSNLHEFALSDEAPSPCALLELEMAGTGIIQICDSYKHEIAHKNKHILQ
jgi:hypothetical protein